MNSLPATRVCFDAACGACPDVSGLQANTEHLSLNGELDHVDAKTLLTSQKAKTNEAPRKDSPQSTVKYAYTDMQPISLLSYFVDRLIYYVKLPQNQKFLEFQARM